MWMTRADLPAGFVNHGTVLNRSNVRIDGFEAAGNNFKLRVHGYNSHGYCLQWTDDLSSGIWHDDSPQTPVLEASSDLNP
jgi:hypothetical protein